MAALRAQAPAPLPSEQESIGALVARLGSDVTRIVRAEIRLFQVRVSAAVGAAKAAAAGVAAGAVLGVVGLALVMLGLVFVVARFMPLWAAAFAVGGGLIVVAAILVTTMVRTLTHGVKVALAGTDEGEPDEARSYGE